LATSPTRPGVSFVPRTTPVPAAIPD